MSATTLAVPSSVNKSTEFLSILIIESGNGWKISVRPTELGRKQLNNFWPEWLRDLIQSDNLSQRLTIEISNKFVSIWPQHNVSQQRALSTIMRAAQSIKPVEQPLCLDGGDRNQHFMRVWAWHDATDEQIDAIRSIRLPGKAKVVTKAGLGWTIGRGEGIVYDRFAYFAVIRPKKSCSFSIGQLSRIFEYKVAMAVAEL